MGGNALRQPSCRLNKQELLGLIVNFNNEIGESFKTTSSGDMLSNPSHSIHQKIRLVI